MEYGGLVFVYMGPPGTEPLLPHFDIIDPDRGEDVILRGMRLWGDCAVGMVRDCNWLQHYENIVDPYHLLMLHQWILAMAWCNHCAGNTVATSCP
jgi:phenylpropionate dioxygenase-like ring-hydroxylating dioxygenase large terminal subunit